MADVGEVQGLRGKHQDGDRGDAGRVFPSGDAAARRMEGFPQGRRGAGKMPDWSAVGRWGRGRGELGGVVVRAVGFGMLVDATPLALGDGFTRRRGGAEKGPLDGKRGSPDG